MGNTHGASGAILVVGGGIGGLTAALEAAEVGNDVYLVEKNAYLGGRVAQLNHYFPKLCPPSCGLEINFRRLRENRKIRTYTLTTVKTVTGVPGNYEVNLEVAPRYVNSNCTACGACAAACPDEIVDEFNLGLKTTTAAYLPHDMAFPRRYVIKRDKLSLQGRQAVQDACKYNAVDLDMEAKTVTLHVGAIVWATGWVPYDATRMVPLNYGSSKAIITNMQMERLAAPGGPTDGVLLRPGDNKVIDSIAFVQCAGSRDENYLEYCSAVCCMASLKQITYVRERYPEAKIYVFYIDLRTPGRYENFREKLMGDANTFFIKGKVAEIQPETDGAVTVVAENTITGEKIHQKVDLAVLATGMQPTAAFESMPSQIRTDIHGFILSDNEKGMFVAGCAKKAADVVTTTQSATAAALKAIQAAGR